MASKQLLSSAHRLQLSSFIFFRWRDSAVHVGSDRSEGRNSASRFAVTSADLTQFCLSGGERSGSFSAFVPKCLPAASPKWTNAPEPTSQWPSITFPDTPLCSSLEELHHNAEKYKNETPPRWHVLLLLLWRGRTASRLLGIHRERELSGGTLAAGSGLVQLNGCLVGLLWRLPGQN